MFGSAIFIFTLFNITVLSFGLVYLWPSCDKPGRFVSKYVISTYTKSFVRFWLFTLTCFLTKEWNLFSTSDILTTSSLDHFFFWSYRSFYTTDWHRNTTYLSWTWVCCHSLIMYVLCCCTCPNTNVILTICFFFCLITFFICTLYWLVIYCLTNGPQNPHMEVDLKHLTLFSTEHVDPLFIMTGSFY